MKPPKIGEPPTIIQAVFRGEDKSLGYRRNRMYNIWVWARRDYPVMICRMSGAGRCPYSSVEAFERNWEVMLGAEVESE